MKGIFFVVQYIILITEKG